MARIVRRTDANECRRCTTFCDRVIAPAACVAQECPFLYSYDEPLSGRRFMGCMHKVFATGIDVELFREAERTRAGFGTVRLANYPGARGRRGALREPELLRLARCGARRDPRLRPPGPLRLKVSLQRSWREGAGHKMQTPRRSRGAL